MLRRLKALVSPFVPQAVRDVRTQLMQARFARLSREAAFSEVYSKNLWGGDQGEFCSGTGSGPEFSQPYVDRIRQWLADEGTRSVVDVGCGDFRVGAQLVSPALDYTGVDIVGALVRRNQERFGAENIRFVQLDVAEQRPPQADVALVRQVLQHLSNVEIARVLENCAHYPHLVVTEHVFTGADAKYNVDKPHGPFNRATSKSGVFLDQPPFSLPCEVLLEVDHGPDQVLRTVVIAQHGARR